MKRAFRILLFTALCVLHSIQLKADERILFYKVRVEVNPDRSLLVREEIKVRAEGDQIRRGIYRSLPRYYLSDEGGRKKNSYSIIEVRSNAPRADYRLEYEGDFINLYIGHPDVFLDPGEYSYIITYRADEQVRFFSGYDEVYWNITGDQWSFPIDSIYAEVVTPLGVPALQHAAYSGARGKTGCDCIEQMIGDSLFTAASTRTHSAGEGLTVALGWAKGIVAPPSPLQWYESMNWYLIIGVSGLLLALMYYLWAWDKVGRDPANKIVIPLFQPPHDMSPAVIRFIYKTGFDDKALACAIVNLAVKGYMTIEEVSKKYTLVKKDGALTPLSAGERKVFDIIFDGRNRYELKQSNYKILNEAVNSLRNHLKLEYETGYFKHNFKWVLPGILIALITFAGLFLTGEEDGGNFLTLWLFAWSIGVSILCSQAYKSWKFNENKWGISLFTIPFVFGEFAGLYGLSVVQGVLPAVVVALLSFINVVFYFLMQAPTPEGATLYSQIEGFKMYLSLAESERLAVLHPPEKTPQLFEKYLPYAMALGVEKAWGERFSEIINRAMEAGTYKPMWYHGSHMYTGFDTAGFTGAFASAFSSSVSNYSSAPGSSGSGGGGSSGGGGGGGGGGGW